MRPIPWMAGAAISLPDEFERSDLKTMSCRICRAPARRAQKDLKKPSESRLGPALFCGDELGAGIMGFDSFRLRAGRISAGGD